MFVSPPTVRARVLIDNEIRHYELLVDVNFKYRDRDLNNKQAFLIRIEELAAVIHEEDWSYIEYETGKIERFGILYRYLTHMYEKLKSDGAVILTEKADRNGKLWMYWHTGLFDKEYDDVIFVSQRYADNKFPVFYFSKFEKRSVISTLCGSASASEFF